MHTCPIAGCPLQLPPHRLMCRAHWEMIPDDLRDALWAMWKTGSALDYIHARDAAIAAVNRLGALQPPRHGSHDRRAGRQP